MLYGYTASTLELHCVHRVFLEKLHSYFAADLCMDEGRKGIINPCVIKAP